MSFDSPKYLLDVATFYAEKHLTLAERNEAYAAAVRFANDRGVSHLAFLAAEYAGRVTSKGIYVPLATDRVIPSHIDEAAYEGIADEHPWVQPEHTASCDGSYTKTETGECPTCGMEFCATCSGAHLPELDANDPCTCSAAVSRVA